MSPGRCATPVVAGLLLLLAGCPGGPGAETRSARLDVEWTGADSGHLSGPATAEWCDTLKVLQIQALAGDSGVAIALYPVDSIRPDSYPVLLPSKADSVPPAAAVALRYFAETAVKGYQGDSGRVLLRDTVGGRLSGRFSASLKSATDGSRLRAGGVFHDVPVVRARRGCVARPKPLPPDTGAQRPAPGTGAPRPLADTSAARPRADTGVH